MDRITSQLDQVLNYLKSIDSSLASGKPISSGSAATESGELAPAVSAWDEKLTPMIVDACNIASQISPDLAKNTNHLKVIFDAVRNLIQYASTHQAPPESDLGIYFAEIGDLVQSGFDNPVRSDPLYTHIKALQEGASCLLWMAYKPTPVPFIKDSLPSAQFHGNKLLMEARKNPEKEKDAQWWKTLDSCFKALSAYVGEHHLTGLQWNPKGSKPAAPPKFASAEAAPAPAVQAAPKPAPKPQPKEVQKPKPTAPGVKAPIKQKERRRWRIENFTEGNIVVDEVSGSQTVAIFNCKNCTVKVEGKARNITIENCSKVGVVFDSCIASAEINRCKNIELQPLGTVPIINIESTDGCRLYLSESHVENIEIVTVASTEMNIIAPSGDEPKEFNIPQQFRHKFENGELKTEVVIHG
ncbi:hypothetical protein GEMRC1_008097 [Eukaryota sp. GEM-RC1]